MDLSENAKNKIMVAMSGGVDSSACACLLKEKGYTVAGAYLSLCGEPGNRDAAGVCANLGMDYFEFDYRKEFKECVIDNFVNTYIDGKTPNPCIVCNKTMKFGALLNEAEKAGFGKIATGHYARIEYSFEKKRFLLKKAADERKDQSYVLYHLTQDILSKVIFPLGEYSKPEIREIAGRSGLDVASKKDSQDICFLPDGGYGDFIEEYTGRTFPDGDFVDRDGNVFGRHKGIIRYTIGQRKGLGLSLKEPAYVISKDMAENRVILGSDRDLFTTELSASDVNWIYYDNPVEPINCKARVRYNQKEMPATVYPLDNNRVKVIFDSPVRGITSGQAVVFYDGDYCLGGGTIDI